MRFGSAFGSGSGLGVGAAATMAMRANNVIICNEQF